MPQPNPSARQRVVVIGAGPAGLMAAERLAEAGLDVAVHDQMPSFGRKFLMAGRGGLNLTHSEPLAALLARYRPAEPRLIQAVRDFPPDALLAWCAALGIETFVGSSGRVFPSGLKASPLLRAWLRRLATQRVALLPRQRWLGFTGEGAPRFATEAGEVVVAADATVLALGGASWPRLGSDAAWTGFLASEETVPFAPSNMGFAVDWSPLFRQRFQGAALKRIALRFGETYQRGEAIVTAEGIEGGAVYALSAALRDAIARSGPVTVALDLRPDLSRSEVASRLAQRNRAETVSASLRKALGLPPVAVGLVQEALHARQAGAPLADLVKALPLVLRAPQPIARAISSAGGVAWPAVDARLMLRSRPGVFVCGEMLDWEAPTGGYLLQGCFSTGAMAAAGVLAWLERGSGLVGTPMPG
jgi:uncharacterized flavoprotein (TIGR03862 family)